MKLPSSLLAFALLLVSCSEHVIQYSDYLPAEASDVHLQKIKMGIDFAYYMKAKVDIDGFEAFKRRMELKPATERFTPYSPDEISDWWHPKIKNKTFVREEYSKHSPSALSNIYWAIYEDGYLYFNHSNF